MNLSEFKKAFKRIKQMGWVPSIRKGPTGIGQTLEKLINKNEAVFLSHHSNPIEILSHCFERDSLLPLIELSNRDWKMDVNEAVSEFGSITSKHKHALNFILSRLPNSKGLFLSVENNRVLLRHISGRVVFTYNFDTMAQELVTKYPRILLITALYENRCSIDWFKYDRARLLWGTDSEVMRMLFYTGSLFLRISDGNRDSNRKAELLVKDSNLPWLYRNCRDI